uniref:Putative javelin-like protein n=1 Tax=Corethrella appendiculata TaxID=1370023 RepID=U5EDY3_9DIPT
MASSTTNSTITGIPSSSLASSRREWEPGIRVRRKLTQKENSEITSSLIRSRSNSHSGKKEPKSGEGNNGSVVQDSGFSTETSSSKETHSASSTTGAVQGNAASNTVNRLAIDNENELWNLLDVIHRKSNRLREEVETLQNLEKEKSRTNTNSSNSNNNNNNTTNIHNNNNNNKNNNDNSIAKTIQNQLDRVNKEDVQILRKERDRLLDKLTEYEAETISERIKQSKMQDEVDNLYLVKKDLEDQLKAALSQKLELNSRLHDLHLQFINKSAPSSPESVKTRGARRLSNETQVPLVFHQIPNHDSGVITTSSSSSSTATIVNTSTHLQQQLQKSPTSRLHPIGFTPVIIKQQQQKIVSNGIETSPITITHATTATTQDVQTLGKLDGLISSPNRTNKVRVTDSKKIAAILLETNIVELQRHLLTITVQNQVLQQRLEQATRSRIFLNKKIDKYKEDVEDLKFQLEEKTIELEGTKAQLRVIEAKSHQKLSSNFNSPEHNRSTSTILLSPARDTMTIIRCLQSSSQVSTPSMKAMVPLPMDEMLQHSSSTESAQDQAERDCSRLTATCPDTPKRRPSKIPLPGTKGYIAPKPPTGRNFIASQQQQPQQTNSKNNLNILSGPPSNRSLNKSTGSLYKSAGPNSITNYNNNKQKDSLSRPDSAQSWRNNNTHVNNTSNNNTLTKDSSLDKSRSSSSSIPISSSTKSSPTSKSTLNYHNNNNSSSSSSPLPKLSTRDSLSTRVKNLDSLSRMQSSATTTASNTSLNNKLNSNSSKKDLSSSFTTGQLRDRKQPIVPVRRVSSASVASTAANATDNNNLSNNNNNNNNSNSGNGDNVKVRNTRSSFWNWLKI